MTIAGKEKTQAKKHIMKLVTPVLVSSGFELAAGGQTGGVFELIGNDGARLALCLEVPTFDTFFRMWCYWETENGDRVADGPQSFPYECPNTPGRRRYTFHFHRKAETHQRCATEIDAWVRDELLPWFASRHTADWANPNVIKA